MSVKKKSGLGVRVKQAREAKGLSQQAVVALLRERHGIAISQQAYSKIERGETRFPREIFGIADVLDSNAAWLLFGIEDLDKLDQDAVALALAWMELDEPMKAAMKDVIEKAAQAKKPRQER